MTVQNIPVINKWTGNGTNKEFDFDFRIDSASQLRVSLLSDYDTPLVLGTDYRIIDIDNGSNYPLESGQIEYPLNTSEHEVLTNEETIILELNIPFVQAVPFSQGGITASAIEECLDYNVRLMQRLKQDNDGFQEEIQTEVNTANTNASTALSKATTALSNSNTAVSTANTASTNATNAVNTANSASSTANTASTNATNAVNTANSASSTATAASNKVDELATDIATVIAAADKINQLETAVTTATNAASTATSAATTATNKAAEAASSASAATAKVGNLSDLTTTAKNTVVAAVNELNSNCEKTANKGQANGYCGLDGSGLVPADKIPDNFVLNSGDTMTGTLEFDKSLDGINNNSPDNCMWGRFDHVVGNADPASNIYALGKIVTDNGAKPKMLGREYWRFGSSGTMALVQQVYNYDADNVATSVYTATTLSIAPDGTKGFNFPKCETKPTTTPSAASDKVIVGTKNYLNGEAGYVKYSDGLIIQWGKTAQGANQEVSLLQSYTNDNYFVATTQYYSNYAAGDYGTITEKTKNGFKMKGYATVSFGWFAIGY